MKKLNIKTTKGEFLLVDGDFDLLYPHKKPVLLAINGKYTEVSKIIKLSDITEEQASEIVDDELYDYILFRGHLQNYLDSAIESLNSLIKSKGYHLLENPFQDAGLIPSADQKLYRDAKEKTLYNPYIFKIK